VKAEDVLRLRSTPIASPSFPGGPYRFVDREYLAIAYETDPEALRAQLPEPIEPRGDNIVVYEWIKMPDSSGFGGYTESGVVIPGIFQGEEINFVAQMYLDDEAPIAAGREIWGFPKKYAHPRMELCKDTLTGTLDYAGQTVALGTMGYKHAHDEGSEARTLAALSRTQLNLKIIPGADGSAEICQLIALELTDIQVKGSWSGPGRLHLVPHVNAPVADLPVRRVVGASHYIADLTLPYGRVVHDYVQDHGAAASAAPELMTIVPA
jgi:acetoacetate decarboxylase